MSKPRATTIQQRFGFRDNDLKTPLHDEILLWLDDNLNTVVEKIINYNLEWTPKELAQGDKYMKGLRRYCDGELSLLAGRQLSQDSRSQDDPIRKWTCSPVPQKPTNVKIKSVWEDVISTGSSNVYVVGFIDLTATVHRPRLYLEYERYHSNAPDYSQYIKTKWEIGERLHTLHFEIKTAIKSLGELVRQIRMYQTYTRGDFFIVGPDARFAKPLASQGIGFVKYPMQNQQGNLL